MNMPLRIPVREKVQQHAWPDAVRYFAQANDLLGYLDPLFEAAQKIFPNARKLDVYVGHDVEASADAHLVFDIRTPFESHAASRAARKEWHEALMRICEPHAACQFQLLLDLVSP